MALKKYRFAIGACGPTILHTNIIRAENEEAAARIYLSEIGEEQTDENITELLRRVSEIVPKENPDRILDYAGKEISLGDEVMFIRNKTGTPSKLMAGRVNKISEKSIVIMTQDGESNRVILPEDEAECLPRVIVMNPRPKRTNEGVVDASGYPLLEGDPIVYMKAIAYGRCDGFQTGSVERLVGKSIVVNGTKRTPDRVVVINWQ